MKCTFERLKRLGKNFYFWVFIAFCVSFTFSLFHKLLDDSQGHNQRYNTVVSDGKGYYAYLPALFIYHDLSFKFNEEIERVKHPETMYTDYRYKLDQERVYTKYYVGTCIAYSPFFLAAHGLSIAMGWDADGYTSVYHGSIVLAAIFYSMLALLFFGKILDFYCVKNWVKIFAILGSYFGSNWFYYTTWESSLSHPYSAAIIAIFIYYVLIFKSKPTIQIAVIIGLLLGFITLIRPINILVILFLPLFFTSFKSFNFFVKEYIFRLPIIVPTLLAFFAVVSLQLIIYKIQIDNWFIYGYGHETFYFLKPHILDFLFSFRKGFFVYAPLFVFSLLGLWMWQKVNKFQPIWWVISFFIIAYIFSSWHMWWYGGTWGTRVFIEYLLFFTIPLALFFDRVKGPWQRVAITIACLFIFNNMLQQYQYRLGVLHYEEMNWQLYKDIFMYPLIP